MAGINPLIRQLGLQEILKRDAVAPPPTQDLEGDGVESALAGHVRLAWSKNKLAKIRIDQKLLSCLRARREIYSSAEISAMQSNNGGMNIVWAPLTETKCRAASAWIREIVLPVGEQPWGVDHSPIADLPDEIKQGVVRKSLQKAQQVMVEAAQSGGGVMDPAEFRSLARELGEKLRDEAEETYRKTAGVRAKRMEKQIADRLVDGGYNAAMDAFVEDFVTYPAAVLKGPIYKRHKQLSWGKGWKPEVSDNPIPHWDTVSPFDCYPAPGSKSPQQGDFIERTRFRRDELFDLKGLPGYRDDQIDEALRAYTNGHLEAWLWTESERQRLTQETLFMWMSPPGVIDALNYWGSVPGWKLMSWGVTEDLEPTKEYECNVLVCGRFVLYAALNPNPLGERPYRKACYDEIPGAFWGRSIPDLVSTPQKMCNVIACALADNLSIASGPQVWVHADRFADGEQSMELFPWKIWQMKSDPTQGVNPGIGFFQPDDRSVPLMATFEKWEIRADDSSGIPRYTYGNERAGGSADTMGGLSMLMNNAAKGLRRAIANIDNNVIAPTIADAFVNEMLYNPDHSIKGDCVVVPRGAAAILIRESMQQRRMQYLTIISNPLIAQMIGPKYIISTLREVATAMELPVEDVTPSQDELDAQQQAQAQAAQAQQQQMAQIEQQKQDTELKKEQIISEREAAGRDHAMISDIVNQAVKAAMAAQPASAASAPKQGGRKVSFLKDAMGDIVGANLD